VGKSNRRVAATALSLALMVGGSSPARADIVPVQQDVTVNAANPLSNLNSITTRGGLLCGLDNTGSDYSFFGSTDSFHQVYFVPNDAWDETTVTWNTAPAHGGATAGGTDIGGSAPGDEVRFDVTADAVREAGGDGILSLGFATIDGRSQDLEFFASREFDPDRAFRLETSGDAAVAVPLPPASFPALALMGVGLASWWMRPRWLRG
jgi:hypothetical protein